MLLFIFFLLLLLLMQRLLLLLLRLSLCICTYVTLINVCKRQRHNVNLMCLGLCDLHSPKKTHIYLIQSFVEHRHTDRNIVYDASTWCTMQMLFEWFPRISGENMILDLLTNLQILLTIITFHCIVYKLNRSCCWSEQL